LIGLDDELSVLREEVTRLRAEKTRLMRLLELTPQQARPPDPVQTGVFDGRPRPVHTASPAAAKVAFSPVSSPPGPTSMRSGGRTLEPDARAGS
jgi:hypothetical protein